MNENTKTKINRFFLLLSFLVLLAAIYIMKNNMGVENKEYGPGSYYYSDIPGWEKIFYGDDQGK